MLQRAGQCEQLALARFVRVSVVVTVLPADNKVRFSDPNLRPYGSPTVFLVVSGFLPAQGGRAVGGAVAVWNLAGC